MHIVYCVGNALLAQDRLPLQLMPRLQEQFPGMLFRELDPSETMPEERELTIIDTVIGIDEVRTINDIDVITTGKVYSLHDFDLGFTLKLMKKAGRLDRVRIIGVPATLTEDKALSGVARELARMERIDR